MDLRVENAMFQSLPTPSRPKANKPSAEPIESIIDRRRFLYVPIVVRRSIGATSESEPIPRTPCSRFILLPAPEILPFAC